MQVLYKELKSFAHLVSYLRQNSLEVIYANVAISWAIHDQKLDDTMDISNKTTTNISAEDFCRGVELGGRFADNVQSFHQAEMIESLKKNLDSYEKVHEHFSDNKSKQGYFSLLLYFLCPYLPWVLGRVLGAEAPFGTFDHDEMPDIIENQIEIGREKPGLTLSIVYRYSHVVDMPLLVWEINPKQEFRLGIYQMDQKYQVIFYAEPEEDVAEAVVAESPVTEPEVAVLAEIEVEVQVSEEETEEVPEEIEEIQEEIEVSEEETEETQEETEEVQEETEEIQEETEEIQEEIEEIEEIEVSEEETEETQEEIEVSEETVVSEEETEETQEEIEEIQEETEEVQEETAENKIEVFVSGGELTEVDRVALEDLLKDIHLPESEAEITDSGRSEEVAQILENMSPTMPQQDLLTYPRDTIYRSLELLGTMDELLLYLRENYQIQDDVYVELLDSMAAGVLCLKNIFQGNVDGSEEPD